MHSKETHTAKHCPCGSQLLYENCCGLFIEGKQQPTSPELLMRSRYTAYTLANIDYIKKTMKGKPLIGFDDEKITKWAMRVTWVGLHVLNTAVEGENQGTVEFIARYIEGDWLKCIHEISDFKREHTAWFYLDGQHPASTTATAKQKVSRNASCPCGSQKKYKNCHEGL